MLTNSGKRKRCCDGQKNNLFDVAERAPKKNQKTPLLSQRELFLSMQDKKITSTNFIEIKNFFNPKKKYTRSMMDVSNKLLEITQNNQSNKEFMTSILSKLIQLAKKNFLNGQLDTGLLENYLEKAFEATPIDEKKHQGSVAIALAFGTIFELMKSNNLTKKFDANVISKGLSKVISDQDCSRAHMIDVLSQLRKLAENKYMEGVFDINNLENFIEKLYGFRDCRALTVAEIFRAVFALIKSENVNDTIDVRIISEGLSKAKNDQNYIEDDMSYVSSQARKLSENGYIKGAFDINQLEGFIEKLFENCKAVTVAEGFHTIFSLMESNNVENKIHADMIYKGIYRATSDKYYDLKDIINVLSKLRRLSEKRYIRGTFDTDKLKIFFKKPFEFRYCTAMAVAEVFRAIFSLTDSGNLEEKIDANIISNGLSKANADEGCCLKEITDISSRIRELGECCTIKDQICIQTLEDFFDKLFAFKDCDTFTKVEALRSIAALMESNSVDHKKAISFVFKKINEVIPNTELVKKSSDIGAILILLYDFCLTLSTQQDWIKEQSMKFINGIFKSLVELKSEQDKMTVMYYIGRPACLLLSSLTLEDSAKLYADILIKQLIKIALNAKKTYLDPKIPVILLELCLNYLDTEKEKDLFIECILLIDLSMVQFEQSLPALSNKLNYILETLNGTGQSGLVLKQLLQTKLEMQVSSNMGTIATDLGDEVSSDFLIQSDNSDDEIDLSGVSPLYNNTLFSPAQHQQHESQDNEQNGVTLAQLVDNAFINDNASNAVKQIFMYAYNNSIEALKALFNLPANVSNVNFSDVNSEIPVSLGNGQPLLMRGDVLVSDMNKWVTEFFEKIKLDSFKMLLDIPNSVEIFIIILKGCSRHTRNNLFKHTNCVLEPLFRYMAIDKLQDLMDQVENKLFVQADSNVLLCIVRALGLNLAYLQDSNMIRKMQLSILSKGINYHGGHHHPNVLTKLENEHNRIRMLEQSIGSTAAGVQPSTLISALANQSSSLWGQGFMENSSNTAVQTHDSPLSECPEEASSPEVFLH